MGHGLKLITFYVQKHIAALGMCHYQALVRDTSLGETRICETGLLLTQLHIQCSLSHSCPSTAMYSNLSTVIYRVCSIYTGE